MLGILYLPCHCIMEFFWCQSKRSEKGFILNPGSIDPSGFPFFSILSNLNIRLNEEGASLLNWNVFIYYVRKWGLWIKILKNALCIFWKSFLEDVYDHYISSKWFLSYIWKKFKRYRRALILFCRGVFCLFLFFWKEQKRKFARTRFL